MSGKAGGENKVAMSVMEHQSLSPDVDKEDEAAQPHSPGVSLRAHTTTVGGSWSEMMPCGVGSAESVSVWDSRECGRRRRADGLQLFHLHNGPPALNGAASQPEHQQAADGAGLEGSTLPARPAGPTTWSTLSGPAGLSFIRGIDAVR